MARRRGDEGPETAAWRLTREEQARAFASDDARERLRAFVDKRPPVWTGH